MRICASNLAADCSVSSSPSSTPSSSVTAADSLSSSQDSSSSCQLSTALPRCRGLDLLVKAIHQVNAGSVIGVPYIQRRVTIRRRPRSPMFEFDSSVLEELRQSKRVGIAKKAKKGKNLVGLSSRAQDSAAQPLRRRSNRAVKMVS